MVVVVVVVVVVVERVWPNSKSYYFHLAEYLKVAVWYSPKADTHYPYVRPVHMARLYGPYVWVHFLTPLRTHIHESQKCTRTYGPSVRAVRTGAFLDTHMYGPYVWVVHIGLQL